MEVLSEKLKYALKNHLPFAVYSKPGTKTVVGIFQRDKEIRYLEDYTQKGFVFAPFEGHIRLWIPAEKAEVITAAFDRVAAEVVNPDGAKTEATAKEDFESLVAKSIEAIREGQFEKLVCSRVEREKIKDIAQVYFNLVAAYPDAFRYCFYSPISGLWMGATPEQLLRANGDTIQTVALAGTQLYKEGEEAIWPAKEQEEQRFVTNYILAELNDYTEDVTATEPYTFRAGNIVHIKTDIKARLKEGSFLRSVIDTLHPTPAVCGLPKETAKAFLLENEGYDREYYSGFLGELNHDFSTGEDGKTDLFVNLRCMKIMDDTAHLFVGCGITKDSDPEKEFIETVNKSMTMRRILF